MPKVKLPSYVIHDFRVTDKILAQTEPDAGDVVFLGRHGTTAFPFVVTRKISGPGGWYVDACEIVDPEGATVMESRRRGGKVVARVEQRLIAGWDKKFEVEGSSVPTEVVDELRGIRFPRPGKYVLRYSVYDDAVMDVPFEALQEDPPYGIIVPGPLDASLAKSTIAWLRVPQPDGGVVERPVWYGYKDGRVYVLVGEGEQDIPNLTEVPAVTVVARSKDKQSRVAEADCSAVVLPKDAEWDKLARDVLVGRRLNLTDGDKALDRWKKSCEIVALTPVATAG